MPRYSLMILSIMASGMIFTGCISGYKKVDGRWAYVTWDEAAGRRISPLLVDVDNLQKLKKKEYAKDKNYVFLRGHVIPDADPATYTLIDGSHYAVDKDNVYLFYYKVPCADPKTFVVLGFPYAKDASTVYCGTLPLNVQNIDEFEVIQSSGNTTITDAKAFIQRNKEYSYLDTLQLDAVVYGDGTAQTKSKKFDSYRVVDEKK